MITVKRAIAAGRRSATGERGLVAAIVGQAYLDYLDNEPGALDYFGGPVYRHHLQLLGLPGDWLPELIESSPIY